MTLWLEEDDDSGRDFFEALLGILVAGQRLGGKAARGFGNVAIDLNQVQYRKYDGSTEYGKYLDDHRTWRSDPNALLGGQPLKPLEIADDSSLTVQVKLGIPRGQDVLFADGRGLEHDIEPERIVDADGKPHWRLRGSTMRGMLRAWFTRLAAKESPRSPRAVADNVTDYKKWHAGKKKGEFHSFEDKMSEASCPVYALFGSPSKRGRIHVSNAYAACSTPVATKNGNDQPVELQQRMHVAVDRVTGGAAESMLFENTVITSQLDEPFEVEIKIEDCQINEARWLSQSLLALHLGIIRVGSSKSSGRLEIVSLDVGTRKEDCKREFERVTRQVSASHTGE